MTIRLSYLLIFGGLAVAAVGAAVGAIAFPRHDTRTVVVTVTRPTTAPVSAAAGSSGHSDDRAAEADVRAAVPSMEAFYSAHGTYVGATPTVLRAIDTGLSTAVVTSHLGASYCVGATVGGKSWSVHGPGATAWYRSVSCTPPQVDPH